MSNDTDEYLICLTAPGTNHPRLILSILPTERLATLYQRASQEFSIPLENSHSLLLFCGIPPRQLPLPLLSNYFNVEVESKSNSKSQEFDSILVRSLVARNDLVTVRRAFTTTTTITTTASTTSTTTTASTKVSNQRSQRAAAKAATESFASSIRVQEEQTIQRRPTTKTKPKSTSTTRAFTTLPPGRRLVDGDTIMRKKTNINTTNNNSRRKNQSSSAPTFRQESDISTALLTALQSGGGRGKVGQVLRTVMSSALSSSYQATRAVVRIAAVQANQYTIVLQPNTTTLQITFSKMTQGRGDYEDVVDWIPVEALTQVMTAIHASDPESFRPMTLAQISPRVFWSLLYHTGCPTTLEETYSTLLPELDWTFLKRRKYTLSEKAMENLRQEEEQQQDHKEDNLQAACEVVQAVENAMDTLQAHDRHRQRDQVAKAALARFSNSNDNSNSKNSNSNNNNNNSNSNASQDQPLPEQQCPLWSLVTPTELDEDELMACLAADNEQQHVASLIQMNIVNWRLLANCQSSYLSEALHLPEATIDKWLDHAQQESLQEIMVEICDLNIRAVEALGEEAKSGTPKDLANWRRIPDMLWATTPSIQNDISIITLETWCQRSYHVLQEFSWMNWYATPVD